MAAADAAAATPAQQQEPPPPPGTDPSKTRWPELVGKPAKEARIAIEADRPELTVIVVPPHSLVTADYRSDRGEGGQRDER